MFSPCDNKDRFTRVADAETVRVKIYDQLVLMQACTSTVLPESSLFAHTK